MQAANKNEELSVNVTNKEGERKRKERLTRRHIDEAFDGGFLESVKLFLADGEKEEILKDFDQSIRGKCRPHAVSLLSQTQGIEKKRREGRERKTNFSKLESSLELGGLAPSRGPRCVVIM